MFEAQVAQGVMWKKIVEAVKELVSEANLQATSAGIGIQSMDSAHVALVSLSLRKGGFSIYECERSAMLGINLSQLSKILKASDNSDTITLRHLEDSDALSIVAEAPDRSKTSEFQLKLMEIDAESMAIPDMEYGTTISMSSTEFSKVCRDMSIFGDTVTVDVARDGVKFSASSDFGDGFVFLRAGSSADAVKREPKKEKESAALPPKAEVKAEGGNVKRETMDEDDVLVTKATTKSAVAKADKAEADASEQEVVIKMEEPISLSFALRYFTTFSKASTLSSRVNISLAAEAPCMIEFEINGLGSLRYYLAPKVEEE